MAEEEPGDNAIFGYGGLILPTSLVSRFTELERSVDSIYEDGLTLEDENLTREEAREAWNRLKDDIDIIPVKIPGFRRKYSYESDRGGAMLESEYTGDEDDHINGVLVTGLDERQKEQIDSTEDGYDRIEIPAGEIDHYLDEETLEQIDSEIPDKLEIYVEDEGSDRFDDETDRTRNPTYHARILKGIEMIGELYGEEIAEEFYQDFLETTEERNFVTEDRWKDLSYKEAIDYLFEEVLDEE